ncbi:helix-turn-helix domain-containing protein [Faecalibacter bovis]|uniref:Helix-turn-helix transcriptional regulator n=1 Tax=Faecalibacter bovis TaxID=2898187 RepID=A0ABX7XFG3_9FLAO|nr:helix-turn-helix transcriptional regulator [Faecalibacter bovis]QTV06564.1 helix-turn-helix transcriptional regulator [Faecalibacter bovis]
MENPLFIITAVVLVIILAISIYFLISKKKENQAENTTQPIIEEKEATIFPEKEIDVTVEKNLEISIEKKIDDIPVEQIKKEENKTETPKKENQKISKNKKSSTKEVDQPKLNINISSKTEKTLLKKIEAFENSKDFLKKDVNLNNLAKQFDTNTKYLSEIIKSYKNKNFNQYLNELRIHHLIDELNNNEKVLNTKVSYLASDFGFNSHSSFSTLFTQYVGQSPSEYIKALKEAKKEKITE